MSKQNSEESMDEIRQVLIELVDKVGQQVTNAYESKYGIWEGISIDNQKSMVQSSLKIQDILSLYTEQRVKEVLESITPPELEITERRISETEESTFRNGERTMSLKWKIAIKESIQSLSETV